ncbi:DUF7507 domain-containing protein [Mobilicoccus caccae]|uniref:DUF7507 domain-containing protein n=1 Tax=Mobilicoccus caccae TaxID=1859295 RepID=A0ABQ6IJC7_9MICO|nr:hypothetical protein [Mobilicoccus caccae]GMA38020.1 hypothetical protein GCM10025883_00650 [Mobilicoccus caccae]
MTKTATISSDANGDGMLSAGDAVTYTFSVTNRGPAQVSAPEVTDPLLASRGITATCPAGPIAAGSSVTCTSSAPMTATERDVSTTTLENRASVQALTAQGNRTPVAWAYQSAPVAVPTLSLTKSATLEHDGMTADAADEGDTVRYTFRVVNTGTVPLTGVAIDDPLLAAASIAVTCETTDLAPGASTPCTAAGDYTVRAPDIAEGLLRNVATATGTATGGLSARSDNAKADIVGGQTAEAELDLRKYARRAGLLPDAPLVRGQEVTYGFIVVNTGTVRVDDITVADPMLTGPITCAATTLEPGGSTTCAADAPYLVTAADVTAAKVTNTATVSGRPEQGPALDVTGSGSITIPAEARSSTSSRPRRSVRTAGSRDWPTPAMSSATRSG